MSTEEEATLSVAAQLINDPEMHHVATIGGASPGIVLELVDQAHDGPQPQDDEWDLDPTADLALKITMGGVDPVVAAQLLRIAAEFLDEATIEDDEKA
ncbi:hypothetical protein [Nocardioides pacificus]